MWCDSDKNLPNEERCLISNPIALVSVVDEGTDGRAGGGQKLVCAGAGAGGRTDDGGDDEMTRQLVAPVAVVAVQVDTLL